MRIGELLVEQRKLARSDLDRVLADRRPGLRLVSALIETGVLAFDDGARALGQHWGIPAALAKHLNGRDPEVVKLLPAELGRAACALPIGRTSGGVLIVCVRDPAPALLERLREALKTELLMVVAPAQRLEDLIELEYGAPPADEFDVDFSSSVEVMPPPKGPPMPDMDALDPDSVRLALTDLDDARVDKDFTQSGVFALPRAPSTPPKMTLDIVKVALDRASGRDAAADAVMGFIAGNWNAGLVLVIRDGSAVGHRGHNVKLPETVRVPFGPAANLAKALRAALANAAVPVVVPVLVKGTPVAAIAVGDPLGDVDTSALGKLAELLGRAYERMVNQ
jgi:hypothetical protein